MGKLALRKPDVPASVVPIFRYDHTQIPNFFFDQILPELSSASEIGIVLLIFKFMSERQDEEIITTYADFANHLNKTATHIRETFDKLSSSGILIVNRLERKNRNLPYFVQIKIPNRVNYKNS